MELGIIEEKLEATRTRIRKERKCLRWCILTAIILALIMLFFAIKYGTSEPDMQISEEQKAAER